MSGALDIIQRVDKLKSGRSNWESHWQDCADYVMPRKNSITRFQSSGARKSRELYNSRAIRNNKTLAAGLFSYLCPPNAKWFELKAKYEPLNKVDGVKRWMSEVTRIVYDALAASNFNLQIHETFLDLGCFGTACLYEQEGDETVLNFSTYHISGYYVCENKNGIIDTVYRKFTFTARQAVQKFGKDRLCADIVKAADDEKQKDREFEFVHAVFPREEYEGGKLDGKNMPFASIYIDITGKSIISEGGYREMPFMSPRFLKAPNEVYGDSPAMDVLPEIKMLNTMKKTTIVAAEKVVDPPWLLPNDGALSNNFSNRPGALNYWNLSGGSQNKPEPILTKADIGLSLEMMQQEVAEIDQAFYIDLFNMLAEKKNMTATEVLERVAEKLIAFSPTLGRMQTELFNPMIIRSLGILGRAGELPPAPPELAAYPYYDIVHVSKIALVIKQLETKALGQTLEYLGPLFGAVPDMMDNFNFDAIAQGVSRSFGMPNEWVRSDKDVAGIRQQRAKQQAAIQQMEVIKQAAETLPKLQGETKENSPLDMLMKMGKK